MGQGRNRIGGEGMLAWLIAVLVAVLFLTASIAQAQQNAAPPGPSLDLSLYALPDGTAPVLCLSGSADGKHDPGGGCPFCRVTDPSVLPLPGSAFEPCRFSSRLRYHPRVGQVVRLPVFSPFAPPTGPPVS